MFIRFCKKSAQAHKSGYQKIFPCQDATAARVREVLNATYDRLREFTTGSDQERAQVAQVGEAFEVKTIKKRNNDWAI
jgi:hypothetical protein